MPSLFFSPLPKDFIMENIKPRTTLFDHNYHSSEVHSSSNVSEYVRHNMDVYNEVDGLSAVYKNGGYGYGDFSAPSTKYLLSEGGGADRVLVMIDLLCVDEINNFTDDDLAKFIEGLSYDAIKTKADILDLLAVIEENLAAANKYAKEVEAGLEEETAEAFRAVRRAAEERKQEAEWVRANEDE